MKDNHIEFVHGKGKRKSEIQKLYDELKENAMKLWEYSIHLDMLGNRNSCSKTDVDATFMHMKYDYYNHTNVFKPGYNIQIGVSDGFIRNIYVSSDSNDLKTYITHLFILFLSVFFRQIKVFLLALASYLVPSIHNTSVLTVIIESIYLFTS